MNRGIVPMSLTSVITALVLIILIPAMILTGIVALLGALNRVARNSILQNGKPIPPETVRAAKDIVERIKNAGKQESEQK
jgi:hypothetical protein